MIKKSTRRKETIRKRKLFKILSIDGGGIRGIIPAIILAEVEKKTGKPISETFDLIAGCSSGGVLALALNIDDGNGKPKYSAKDLITLYEKEGERIFSRNIIHTVMAMGNILDQKYPSYGIDKVLTKYFGDTMLSQSLSNVIVPAYEIERRHPFYFKSYYAKDPDKQGYDFKMRDVAKATSAAPTYFEPVKLLTGDHSEYYALVDGGIGANNPSMSALIDAYRISKKKSTADFFLLSLGTGRVTRRLPYEDARGWGVGGWAKPLLSSVYDAVSQTVDYQVRQILSPENYIRIQARLDEENDDLDNTSRENIRDLKVLAENLVWEKKKEILNLVNILTK